MNRWAVFAVFAMLGATGGARAKPVVESRR